ncbi:hypothetical protein AB0O34_25890 [Sphaerisporangium sp. NPDC088356]|uniref:hypothetical protein n=1 Tax=Sphaerisporangium sp. NPDC088356 TaxID=3154871 RepID=UPI003413630F
MFEKTRVAPCRVPPTRETAARISSSLIVRGRGIEQQGGNVNERTVTFTPSTRWPRRLGALDQDMGTGGQNLYFLRIEWV